MKRHEVLLLAQGMHAHAVCNCHIDGMAVSM